MMIIQKNRYFNRDLSWLHFNARVLQEAADVQVPLLERMRFIGIFSNNLDEFFKVRYAAIKRIADAGKSGKKELGGYRAKELLEQITRIVIAQQHESLKILSDIEQQLKEHNIFIINELQVPPELDGYIREYFINEVSPSLTTIILNYLEEMSALRDSVAYLAVKMTAKGKSDSTKLPNILKRQSKELQYALVEIPQHMDRFVVLPSDGDRQYIIILDDLIRYCLGQIFSIFDYESLTAHMIKITRDAQLDIDSDLSKSLIEKISSSVQDRRSGEPVRFIYDKEIGKDTLQFLLDKMNIEDSDSIIPGGRYHNRRDYTNFPNLGRKDLLYHKQLPLPVYGFKLEGSIFSQIANRDFLMHSPYHTFSYVLRFLREAALDPKVVRIKITIYRLAKNSDVINALINAARNGKEVTVQIELQARFDETANIRYAEQLELEGIQLIFGVPGLKVHAKTCLVERKEGIKIKRFGFISTGNFNESTARIYTDYTLFTADQGILKDISKVFNFFDINYRVERYQHLIVSPHYTRKGFYKLINHEIRQARAGKEAFIKLKMNSLSDYLMIDHLYTASRAGVKIQLIVRGICCLVPGISGMSENIEVISIVDKFLEHTRLFIFCNGGNPLVFIGSADFMTRNIDHRVEVTCPIYSDEIKQELIETFDIAWKDNVKARVLTDGDLNKYRINSNPKLRSQEALYSYYKAKLNQNHFLQS